MHQPPPLPSPPPPCPYLRLLPPPLSPLTRVNRYMARPALLSFLSTKMAGIEQRTAGTKITVK